MSFIESNKKFWSFLIDGFRSSRLKSPVKTTDKLSELFQINDEIDVIIDDIEIEERKIKLRISDWKNLTFF